MCVRGDRSLRMQTPRFTSPGLERSTAYRGTPKAGGAFAVWQLSRRAHASGSFLLNRTLLESTKSLHRQAFYLLAMRHTQSAHTSGHPRRSIPAPATKGGCCRDRSETAADATAVRDNCGSIETRTDANTKIASGACRPLLKRCLLLTALRGAAVHHPRQKKKARLEFA